MSLKHTYTLIAPFYDAAIDRATRASRKRSLSALGEVPGRVLLAGKGHEQSIIVGREKTPWDDRTVARAELRRLLGHGAS